MACAPMLGVPQFLTGELAANGPSGRAGGSRTGRSRTHSICRPNHCQRYSPAALPTIRQDDEEAASSVRLALRREETNQGNCHESTAIVFVDRRGGQWIMHGQSDASLRAEGRALPSSMGLPPRSKLRSSARCENRKSASDETPVRLTAARNAARIVGNSLEG
jgi:hypothetical protein